MKCNIPGGDGVTRDRDKTERKEKKGRMKEKTEGSLGAKRSRKRQRKAQIDENI